MPQHTRGLTVSGTVRHLHDTIHLVLHQRLVGYDTFLTGTLDIFGHCIRVRILTFDDVTVLRPLDQLSTDTKGLTWTGILRLRARARDPRVPEDLATAAAEHGRDLNALDAGELHYALTFLAEATTPSIRQARIGAIVAALPAVEIDPARDHETGGTSHQEVGR